MRKIILSVLVLASLSTKAQIQDSVIVDTVAYSKGAIHIQPVIVNAQGDSAFSIVWSAFNLSSDGSGCNTYVTLRGRKNQQLAEFNCPIPASVVAVWGVSNEPVDEFILSQYPRFKKD